MKISPLKIIVLLLSFFMSATLFSASIYDEAISEYKNYHEDETLTNIRKAVREFNTNYERLLALQSRIIYMKSNFQCESSKLALKQIDAELSEIIETKNKLNKTYCVDNRPEYAEYCSGLNARYLKQTQILLNIKTSFEGDCDDNQ